MVARLFNSGGSLFSKKRFKKNSATSSLNCPLFLAHCELIDAIWRLLTYRFFSVFHYLLQVSVIIVVTFLLGLLLLGFPPAFFALSFLLFKMMCFFAHTHAHVYKNFLLGNIFFHMSKCLDLLSFFVGLFVDR